MSFFSKKTIFAAACLVALCQCASDSSIFPDAVTSTTESEVVLPNPISIIADEDNGQIIVANSNVDIFFDTGTIALLNVDATDPDAPQLSASQIVSTANFAGELYFDDTNNKLYTAFRESFTTDSDLDQIQRFSVGAGTVSSDITSSIAADPFGITGDATQIYTISDDTLTIYNLDLSASSTINLTAADDADLDDADATNVEYVTLDATNNRAIVSNPNGRLFIVDLDSSTLTTVIDGPEATRNLIVDNDTLYALDPILSLVWIFNLNGLADPSSTPGEIDDSTFLIDTVSVGSNPNGMALDSVNNRLYVGNSNDNTVSVIDTLTFTELTRISIDSEDLTTFERGGEFPFALTLGTFGGTQYLFIASFDENSIIMINTDTLAVVELYPNNDL